MSNGCGLSLDITERRLSWLQATNPGISGKWWSHIQRPVVQHLAIDGVKTERRPAVHFTYTNYSFKSVNSDIVLLSIVSLERLSPKGSCQLDVNSRNDTLAQKNLIELLLWSASGVHKQSPKVWQENWMTWRENQCRRILSLSLQKATVPSDEVSSKSDCENRTVDWNLFTPKFWGRFWCSKIQNGNWKQTTCRY